MLSALEESMEEVGVKSAYNGYVYCLSDVLITMICGMLAGITDINLIDEWSKSENAKALLEKEFGITKTPSRSQFYYILSCVNYEALAQCFSEWMASMLRGKIKNKVIAIDGKTICSTAKLSSDGSALHIVSAIVSGYGLVIASKACKHKGYEVKTFRELIELIDISGALLVADALHCKTKTASRIIELGGDYLFAVKKNNLHLYENIEVYSHNNKDDEYKTIEKNGGRIEMRTAFVANDIENFPSKENWTNLSCVGSIHREFENVKTGEKTSEWHYYICSKNLCARELLESARFEWQIESMHWLLDVHFMEDKTKLIDMQLQKGMNLLRKVVLNLIRKYKESQPKNTALTRIMARNLYDTENFSNFLQYLRNCDI